MDEKINVEQAAEMLGMSKAQVYRRIHSGVITARRAVIGGCQALEVDASSVRRLAEQGGTAPIMNPDGALMRVTDAATLLGVSAQRVRQMVHDGQLAVMRSTTPKARMWVYRASVQAMLDAPAGVR